ncbi:hypothetical protein BU26DRAFT_582121 [Trematosphaeria pertusa]|uniref:RING-type domain-containing protein n=1 Tax=Trematosphaeria pertusa TaxID=390896 RepID=A0A6A6HXY0_9PLEO|nr:uncharacterized protein BU26DRAFT_582121 [Trematosphaeria pertusa]KAF2243075.1 hypothetical protein BU26DRAFT_582121 [Trematosphaeria pertusa]
MSQQLPTRQAFLDADGLQPLECPICRQPFDLEEHSAQQVRGCNHFFGERCIRRWFRLPTANHHTCPICRVELFQNEHDADAGSPRTQRLREAAARGHQQDHERLNGGRNAGRRSVRFASPPASSSSGGYHQAPQAPPPAPAPSHSSSRPSPPQGSSSQLYSFAEPPPSTRRIWLPIPQASTGFQTPQAVMDAEARAARETGVSSVMHYAASKPPPPPGVDPVEWYTRRRRR